MILVINLNASVDKRYKMKDLIKGEVMRAAEVDNTPGGKGIHVANVATILGEDCIATGYLGGKSGEFISEKLQDYGIKQDFVQVAGETRSCLAIITESGAQTEILEPGPTVTPEEQEAFMVKYQELLSKATVVAASGSMPKGLPGNFYGQLISLAHKAGKPFLLDTSGEALIQGIKAQPYFVKPNNDEIKVLVGAELRSDEDIVHILQKFMEDGIKLPVISLGAQGSMAGYNQHVYKITVPKIQCKNPVGSGDSFVAGIAVGIERGMAIEDVLSLGAACGTANAMEDESGFVRKEVVEELFPQIKIQQIV